MEAGLYVVAYILISVICRVEGLTPADCRPMTPSRFGQRFECDAAIESIKSTFPNVHPEQFGFPKGTRLHIKFACRPLYSESPEA